MDHAALRKFNRRTSNIYHDHKRRAKQHNTGVDYTVDGLRAIVQPCIGTPCPFCLDTQLTPTNFSIDHSTPTSRGGRHSFYNLTVCCERCNQLKGALTTTEFNEILAVIRNWKDPGARRDIYSRLRSGGRFRK